MYKLLIEKQVEKQLRKIPEPDYSKVKAAILGLAAEPRPSGCEKLTGRVGYRIRKGNYRIIYDVDDQEEVVYILAAGDRKDVYSGN